VQCRAQGLAFFVEFEPDARRHAHGDRVRIEQILGNLLSNALKFTADGSVTLRVALGAEDLHEFVVEDTGIGFDRSVADQLFRPFQQADNSITRRFGGSGLGLSISRELARAMGGDLTGEGHPGAGARFKLELSLPAAEPPASTSSPAGASHPTEARPLRVLVADDHETNRTLVTLIFDSVGVETVGVENGAEAVEAWAMGGFDLVLMDMQMPVMDGLSAIREIRRREAEMKQARSPILMLSANAMPEHLEAAFAAGADRHIAKPVTAPTLIEAVERALAAADPAAEAAA
jgi:CheY-like chemotaxis protein